MVIYSMLGIIFAIISGVAMSIQGIFNTHITKKIGVWETTALIQGIAFLTALIVLFFAGNGNFKNLKDVNKFYLLAGILGTVITFTVIQSMSDLGPAIAVSTILVAQLVAATLINHFGWFGTEVIHTPVIRQVIGVVIMIIGIIVFKWKG